MGNKRKKRCPKEVQNPKKKSKVERPKRHGLSSTERSRKRREKLYKDPQLHEIQKEKGRLRKSEKAMEARAWKIEKQEKNM